MNTTATATVQTHSFHNLAKFSDLSGFCFGYAGGAKRCSELIELYRNFLTFDSCGNLTGLAPKVTAKGLSEAVWETVKND